MHLVNAYLNEVELQKPEKSIFETLIGKMEDWRMLDIGIGTGRTTLHLAPIAMEYVGIDYSFGMTKACMKRFPKLASTGSIRLGDARMLQEFEQDSFDLVLFSFNGIDYISYDDREHALDEIRRVLKPGGHFIFSTHNLQYIGNLYSIQLANSWKYSLYQCYRYLRLIFENGLPGKYKDKPFAIINDGAHHFALTTYYVKPAVQVEELEMLGFADIRLFSVKSGQEITGKPLDELNEDSWIYYWCINL